MAEGNIAFIGLGTMGYPMAGHLRQNMPASATLYVVDVVQSVCERFIKEYSGFGKIKIETPKGAAEKSKIVISIVPNANSVRQVFQDSVTGIMHAPKDSDRLLLECSTIDIKTCRELASEVAEAGIGTYIDTPVSGGVVGAKAGTLSFLVGHQPSGPQAQRVKDVVSKMGPPEKITLCGHVGTGLAAKIANNYIACGTMLLTAEAFALGHRNGVDLKTLHECVRNSTGNSWVVQYNPAVPDVVEDSPASKNFKPTFKPFMIVKDLSLGIEAARAVGIEPNMAETAVKSFQLCADDDKYKDLDCTSVWLKINEN